MWIYSIPIIKANGTREIRLLARDLGEFGITPDNIGKIRKLVFTLGGTSDPSFIAYNEEALPFLNLENDHFITTKNGSINFNPLENDIILSQYDVPTIDTPPSNGTVKIINNNGIYSFNYIPNTDFTGTDTFTYRVTRTIGSSITSTTATVEIKVLNTAYVNPHLRLKPKRN